MNILWTNKSLERAILLVKTVGKNSPNELERVGHGLMNTLKKIELSNGNVGRPGVFEGTKEIAFCDFYALVFVAKSDGIMILDCTIDVGTALDNMEKVLRAGYLIPKMSDEMKKDTFDAREFFRLSC